MILHCYNHDRDFDLNEAGGQHGCAVCREERTRDMTCDNCGLVDEEVLWFAPQHMINEVRAGRPHPGHKCGICAGFKREETGDFTKTILVGTGGPVHSTAGLEDLL